VPANDAAGTVTTPLPPMADSLSQINVFGTLPRALMSCHMPASRSPACRDGSIVAVRNRENPMGHHEHRKHQILTVAGRDARLGNHKSHCTISPRR
jgi:hypothetical protein